MQSCENWECKWEENTPICLPISNIKIGSGHCCLGTSKPFYFCYFVLIFQVQYFKEGVLVCLQLNLHGRYQQSKSAVCLFKFSNTCEMQPDIESYGNTLHTVSHLRATHSNLLSQSNTNLPQGSYQTKVYQPTHHTSQFSIPF